MADVTKSVFKVALFGMCCLGSLYAKGGGDQELLMAQKAYDHKDYHGSFEHLLKAAKMGSAQAYNDLGAMYKKGQGVEKDYKKALEYYKKAADMGLAEAYTHIGSMHRDGQGVAKDYKKAFQYYQKAAKMGCPKAYWSLGDMYKKGQGIVQDGLAASMYFKKACDKGYKDACKAQAMNWVTHINLIQQDCLSFRI